MEAAPRFRFRSPLDHVLRFAPLLIPILAVALAVRQATARGYVMLAGFLVALAASQLLVRVIKRALRQPRPDGHEERCGTIWEPLGASRKPGYGMPSGHSAAAGLALAFGMLVLFDESRLLSERYSGSATTRYGLLFGAALVAAYCVGVMAHRIVIRCHTPAQVLVGGLVGATMGAAGYVAARAAASKLG
jgi:membrane-associated phospholipid phosphatase